MRDENQWNEWQNSINASFLSLCMNNVSFLLFLAVTSLPFPQGMYLGVPTVPPGGTWMAMGGGCNRKWEYWLADATENLFDKWVQQQKKRQGLLASPPCYFTLSHVSCEAKIQEEALCLSNRAGEGLWGYWRAQVTAGTEVLSVLPENAAISHYFSAIFQ